MEDPRNHYRPDGSVYPDVLLARQAAVELILRQMVITVGGLAGKDVQKLAQLMRNAVVDELKDTIVAASDDPISGNVAADRYMGAAHQVVRNVFEPIIRAEIPEI